MRSRRFPQIPPVKSPSAIPQGREVIDRAKMATAPMAKNESSERKIVALCATLNAAPEFRVSCNTRKVPSTLLGAPPKVLRAIALDPLSIATTAIATKVSERTARR